MLTQKEELTLDLTVYHGAKLWELGKPIRSQAIEYMLNRGESIKEALAYAEALYVELTDYSDKDFLERAMISAQASGYLNPFVSVSQKRSVAQEFALKQQSPGYILTIVGPEEKFYDFHKIRSLNGLPHPREFDWMYEKGIPFEVKEPFRIIKVDKIFCLEENSTCVFNES